MIGQPWYATTLCYCRCTSVLRGGRYVNSTEYDPLEIFACLHKSRRHGHIQAQEYAHTHTRAHTHVHTHTCAHFVGESWPSLTPCCLAVCPIPHPPLLIMLTSDSPPCVLFMTVLLLPLKGTTACRGSELWKPTAATACTVDTV